MQLAGVNVQVIQENIIKLLTNQIIQQTASCFDLITMKKLGPFQKSEVLILGYYMTRKKC